MEPRFDTMVLSGPRTGRSAPVRRLGRSDVLRRALLSLAVGVLMVLGAAPSGLVLAQGTTGPSSAPPPPAAPGAVGAAGPGIRDRGA